MGQCVGGSEGLVMMRGAALSALRDVSLPKYVHHPLLMDLDRFPPDAPCYAMCHVVPPSHTHTLMQTEYDLFNSSLAVSLCTSL